MILKGNQRGGAKQLALHLLNDHDNDHVELRAIQGFVADDLTGALQEMYAVSRATKCKQFMFSLSLSPPQEQIVTIQDFDDAIDQAAEKLGLAGQPRVIIFHEKKARRHCHVVFSRIDVEEMKAINLPFFKTRLTELSRELYLSHGWDLPKGLSDKSLADPTNFDLTEWQEAQRAKRDPRETKAALKKCWAQSDGAQAFEAALKERGFWLCRGDRRGFVALDWKRNIYSLSRWLDVRPTKIADRLGRADNFPSIDEAQAAVTAALTERHSAVLDELDTKYQRKLDALKEHHHRLRNRHRRERDEFRTTIIERRGKEAAQRSKRLRKGLLGIWDWMTGRRRQVLTRNQAEWSAANERDEAALLRIINIQNRASLSLNTKNLSLRRWYTEQILALTELSVEVEPVTSGKHKAPLLHNGTNLDLERS